MDTLTAARESSAPRSDFFPASGRLLLATDRLDEAALGVRGTNAYIKAAGRRMSVSAALAYQATGGRKRGAFDPGTNKC